MPCASLLVWALAAMKSQMVAASDCAGEVCVTDPDKLKGNTVLQVKGGNSNKVSASLNEVENMGKDGKGFKHSDITVSASEELRQWRADGLGFGFAAQMMANEDEDALLLQTRDFTRSISKGEPAKATKSCQWTDKGQLDFDEGGSLGCEEITYKAIEKCYQLCEDKTGCCSVSWNGETSCCLKDKKVTKYTAARDAGTWSTHYMNLEDCEATSTTYDAGALYWGCSYFLAGFALSLFVILVAVLGIAMRNSALQQPLRLHQMFSIYGDGLICANATSIVPESYDLMLALGQGATVSGSLIGSSWCLSAMAVIVIRSMENRLPLSAWKPMNACTLLLSISTIIAFGCLSLDGLNKTASVDRIAKQLFIVRAIMSLFNGMYLLQSLVALGSTPKIEMVSFNKTKMGVKTLGMGVGPLLSSMVASIERTRDPFVLVAAVSYLMAGLFAGMLLLFQLSTLSDHQKLINTKLEVDHKGSWQEADHSGSCQLLAADGIDEAADELAAERLPLEQRNRTMVLSAIYGIERTCMASALEAATSMILEVEFNWSTRDAGWAVGIVFLGTVPYMLFGENFKSYMRIGEIKWMVLCALSSVLACLALFPFSTKLTTVILTADCFIFANGYLANGIVDGLAFRSCSDDTCFSTSQYLLAQAISQMALSRPFGPILARFLVDIGGRGCYALGQLVLSISGLACCLKVAYTMSRIDKTGARSLTSTEMQLSNIVGSPARRCRH